MNMKKAVVLCGVIFVGGVSQSIFAGGQSPGGTAYRLPISSAGINYWFDRNTGGGFLRYDGVTNVGYDTHTGIDFNQSSGSIWAGAKGTVIQIVKNCFDKGHRRYDPSCGSNYGNNVKLQHADGKITAYAHMKEGSVRVNMGDNVFCGQLLGDIGASGTLTSAHLHFETRTGLGLGSVYAYDPFGGADMFGTPIGVDYGWRSSRYTSWTNQNGLGTGMPGTTCQS